MNDAGLWGYMISPMNIQTSLGNYGAFFDGSIWHHIDRITIRYLATCDLRVIPYLKHGMNLCKIKSSRWVSESFNMVSSRGTELVDGT